MKENTSKVNTKKLRRCPEEGMLSAYLSGFLREQEARLLEEHISTCHLCLENIRAASLGATLYEEESLPDSNTKLIDKAKGIAKLNTGKRRFKKNLYLFGTALAFVLSFLFPRYFVQFLVAALILGLKWVFESEGARTLIMVLDSLRRRSKERDDELSDKIKKRL